MHEVCGMNAQWRRHVCTAIPILYLWNHWTDSWRDYGSDIGFIDHFKTHDLWLHLFIAPLPISTYYKSVRVHTKTFPARSLFNRSCLATCLTTAFLLKSSLIGGFLSAKLNDKRVSVIISRFGLQRKHLSSVALRLLPWERLWYICLSRRRFLVTTLHASIWYWYVG